MFLICILNVNFLYSLKRYLLKKKKKTTYFGQSLIDLDPKHMFLSFKPSNTKLFAVQLLVLNCTWCVLYLVRSTSRGDAFD